MKIKGSDGLKPDVGGAHALDLHDYVPYWLASLSRVLVRRMQAKLTAVSGLSIAEWRLMAVVACHPQANAVDVCILTRLDDVAVHRAVRRLMEKSLLQQEVSKEDKRRKRLELTVAGWSVYRQVLPAALEVEVELLEVLDTHERKRFVDLLGRLHRLTANEP